MKYLLSAYCLSLVVLLAGCDSGPRKAAADTAGGREQPAPPVAAEPMPGLDVEADSTVATQPEAKDTVRLKAKRPSLFRSASPNGAVARELRGAGASSTALAPGAAWAEQGAKVPQWFMLRENASDTILACAEGTRIAIPAEAFVDAETQEPAEGPIEFRVQEYLSLADIVLNNLSTTSGDRLLETGGMLNLQATANGRPLTLRPGVALSVAIPREGPEKPGMQTFFAAPAAAVGQPFDWAQMPEPKLTMQRNYYLQKRPRYGAGDGRLKRDLQRQIPFSYPRAVQLARARHKLPKEERRRLKSYRDVVESFLIRFEVGADSVLRNVRAVGGFDTELKATAVRAIQQTKGWRPALCNGQPAPAERSLRVYFLRNGKLDFDFFFDTNFHQESPCGSDTASVAVSSKDPFSRQLRLNAYVLQTTQLGFINCDRYLESPKPKVALTVQAPRAAVQLVFHNFRTIVAHNPTDSKTVFERIPEDEPVTILALRSSEKQVMLATRRTTTGSQTERDLVFRPVSAEELRTELQKLAQ